MTRGGAFVVSGKSGKVLVALSAPEGTSRFGCSVARWLDFDGDGVCDFAVSAPGRYARTDGQPVPCGSVFVYSGKRGAEIARISGRESSDEFGIELANVRDLDGDGKDELLVGASGSGTAYLFSGRNREELGRLRGLPGSQFGEAVCGIGDIDGDGTPDLAVGACCESRTGRVHLYSGKDRHELRVLVPKEADNERLWFGNSIVSAGDLDGDGKPDLLVGSDMEANDSCARVYSGASGQVLLTISQHSIRLFSHFASSVELLGDADGDGAVDFLIGDPNDIPDEVPEGEANQARGSIVLASGKNGATLYRIFGKRHMDCLGDSMAACGDLDGDSVPDFVAKAANHPGGGPCWRAFSGKTGKELWQFDAPEAGAKR